jgi:hypothetical protein
VSSYAALKILQAAYDRELEDNGRSPQLQRLESQMRALERELSHAGRGNGQVPA